jgi:hypothetical protein
MKDEDDDDDISEVAALMREQPARRAALVAAARTYAETTSIGAGEVVAIKLVMQRGGTIGFKLHPGWQPIVEKP